MPSAGRAANIAIVFMSFSAPRPSDTIFAQERGADNRISAICRTALTCHVSLTDGPPALPYGDNTMSASSSPLHITLPDGKTLDFKKGVTGAEIAQAIGPGLAKAALILDVDGAQWDLFRPIEHDAKIRIITRKDPEALELIRHDAAHVLAMAVQELFPGTQVTIGPAIEDGFYYDFARAEPFHPDDLAAIEKRMAEIVDGDHPTKREEGDG